MTTESLLTVPAAISDEVFRYSMARLPTGVAVVTTRGPDGPVGCTVNTAMSLSVRPPALLVSLAAGSRTLDRVLESGFFAVNVLPWSARHLARQFAAGTAAQRFADVSWQPQHGVPVLETAIAAVVCEVGNTITLYDHTLVAGPVVWTRVNEQPAMVLYGEEQHSVGG